MFSKEPVHSIFSYTKTNSYKLEKRLLQLFSKSFSLDKLTFCSVWVLTRNSTRDHSSRMYGNFPWISWFTYVRLSHQGVIWLFVFMDECIYVWDHSFSSYPLICRRMCAYQGIRNDTFSEDFVFVLNGWSFNHICLRVTHNFI